MTDNEDNKPRWCLLIICILTCEFKTNLTACWNKWEDHCFNYIKNAVKMAADSLTISVSNIPGSV